MGFGFVFPPFVGEGARRAGEGEGKGGQWPPFLVLVDLKPATLRTRADDGQGIWLVLAEISQYECLVAKTIG